MKQSKRIVAGMILFVMMSVLLCPMLTYAVQNHTPPRVVRVGCAGIKGFIENTENNRVTGYGVAYLNEIAKKTGWKYTYISGSWSECVTMLEKDEIDILLPTEKSPERERNFIFSKSQCCIDYVGLYTLKENNNLYFDDYQSFDGIRVGMIHDNYLNKYFFDLAKEKGFSFTPVYYNAEHAVDIALEAGTVDAVVNGNLGPSSRQKLLARLGFMPAYFMMNKYNAPLMEELDQAITEMQVDNPYFEAELYKQYYDSFNNMVEGWTREEAEFIKNCPPLRVVCDADNNPIQWLDKRTGEYKGIYVEILKLIAKESGLHFEFVSPKDITDPWKAVQGGEGDLLSAAYGNQELEQAYNMCFTMAYYPEKNSIISRRGRTFDSREPMKIALLDSFISTQYCIKEKYPQWTIIPCSSIEECMQLVADGSADITMTDTITLPYNDYLRNFPTLAIVSTLSVEVPIGIGISKDQVKDYEVLQSVLNKATLRLSGDEVDSYVLGYTIERAAQIGFADLLRSNPSQFFAAAVILLLAISAAGIIFYGSRLKTLQNVQLEQKNGQLEKAVTDAEHARDLYNGLYNMAVCGIAQFQVSRRGVTMLLNANNEAKSILGGQLETYKRALFGRDLQHKLYQADEKLVRRVIRSLKEIGHKDSIEFRVLRSDEHLIWIRTTIELIGYGDHGEKIVQSTFMDITENKQLENQLKSQSERDSLTGLYNKGTMERLCREYLASHTETAYAYGIIDIDNFKKINDTYGHWNGDGVLKEISEVLRVVVCNNGFAGRFGGDEFVILFEHAMVEEIREKASIIIKKIDGITVQQQASLVSASMGIAMGSHCTYEQLFEKADQALYRAKQEGKHCFRLTE